MNEKEPTTLEQKPSEPTRVVARVPDSKEMPGKLMQSREAYRFLKSFLGLPDKTISFRLYCDALDVAKVDFEYWPHQKD